MKYSFLNYHTVYSSDGGAGALRKNSRACFSDIFRYISRGKFIQDYTIYIEREGLDDNLNNQTFLTEKEIKTHLFWVKRNFEKSFKYSIKKCDAESKYSYIIKLTIDGYNITHRFILTYVRYIYEYPFSIIVKEALKLKRDKDFSDISYFDLLNVVGSSMLLPGEYRDDLHSFGRLDKIKSLIPIQDIVKYFHDENKTYISTFMERYYISRRDIPGQWMNINFGDYHTGNQLFKDFKKNNRTIYKLNLELIKKL